jgi:serine/threonine protein kinase
LKHLNEHTDSLHVPRLVAEGNLVIVASPCGVGIKDLSGHVAIFALCAGLCDGLKSIHQAGLVHRDVRPSNIVVLSATEHTAVLVEWAASRHLEGANEYKGPFEGTVYYAAVSVLEQLADSKASQIVVSPATDLESLVYSAYVLLRGTSSALLVSKDCYGDISRQWQEQFKNSTRWQERLGLARSCDYDGLKHTFEDY